MIPYASSFGVFGSSTLNTLCVILAELSSTLYRRGYVDSLIYNIPSVPLNYIITYSTTYRSVVEKRKDTRQKCVHLIYTSTFVAST